MIKRLLLVAALLVGIISGGYYFLVPHEAGVGTALPDAPALFETSLAAPITATADSFTLTANSVRGGGTLSGYQCFTIDEGSAQAEFVCGTASSTSVTGVTRGISPSDGVSEVAALKFAHRRGASVKITDFPVIQIIRNQNNGDSTYENALRYAAGVVPSGASDLADVGYVLSVVNGGTVNFDALVVAGTAGETLATGTLVYFKTSDQRWWKVDSSATSTFQDRAVGITRGNGTAGNAIGGGGLLLKGLQTGLSGLTAGGTYYASSSTGTFSTATSALPIGYAKSTTELYFDPVMISVPRLGFNNTFTGTNTFTGLTVGFGTASVTQFTTLGTTTYTKNPFAKYIIVEMVGGGGGGGGVDIDTGGGVGVSGGGGGYARKLILASQLSATTTVVVGGGGVSGSSATVPTAGSTGSTTSFGNFASSTGGTGGIGDNAPDLKTKSAGGVGNNGDVNIKGGYSFGIAVSQSIGGSSMFGTGGYILTGSGNVAPVGYGAGSAASSPGSQGIVIVTEYF